MDDNKENMQENKDKKEPENKTGGTGEKKRGFSLSKLIYNDKYLIILSVLAAVIIWIAASMNFSPETTKTITVPVNVDFSDSAAEHLGLKCYGEETVDIDVTVTCKKYLAKDITADDITAVLQTNTVTAKGNFEVPIKVDTVGENNDFTISSYYPTVYKAYFDVEESKTMDISVAYENKDFVADGYIMGEPLLSESTAVITGPKTYVAQVKSLVCSVSVDGKINKTQSIDLNVTPVDSSGSSVDYVIVNSGKDNLTLTIPVLKKMELDVTASFTNKPESINEQDLTVTYSTEKVSAGVLEDAEIKEANIGSIDFSQLKPGTNTFTFDLSNLEGMVILDDISEITVTVNVPSDYEIKNVSVNKSDITVANIPEGYDAQVTSVSSNSVTLIGTEKGIDSDNPGIALVVDLAAYENSISAGTSDYKLTVSVENSTECWVHGEYSAKVTLTKQ